ETVSPGATGRMSFEGTPAVNRSGQYWLSTPGWYAAKSAEAAVARQEKKVPDSPQIAPNPVAEGSSFTVTTGLEGTVWFRLFDEKGRAIRVEKFERQTRISTAGLSAGVYVYRLENKQYMLFGKVVVE
ncbi:MAG TPA: T9SS type A sorting domain-containing protein, partial [Saprospiraceae bacterium]|nr:T9SS type A sorting domain-containing protein [Saprospiraceae bacterium]